MMNEKIKQLAEQSIQKYDRLGFEVPFAQPDLEKFATLIIYECGQFVDPITNKFMKKHFGIEE